MKKNFIFLKNILANNAVLVSNEKQNIVLRAREVELNSIPGFIDSGEVYLVLSDHLVSNYELELTAKNQNQLNKVARFAVENKFPERLENYHIVSKKNSNKKVSVRALTHSRFQKLINTFEQLNINLTHIIVESDLIKNNVASLVFDEQEVTLSGKNLAQTYGFDKSVTPLLGEKIFASLNDSDDLQVIYSDEDKMLVESLCNIAPEGIRLKKIIKNESYFESCSLNHAQSINLLQGNYKITKNESETNSLWKYPLYLFATTAVVLTGGLFAQNQILSSKISKQENKLSQQYVNLFPDASKPRDIVDLSIKLKSKFKTSNNKPQDHLPIDALSLLNLTSLAAKNDNIELIALNIDKNAAEILISGPSIEALNLFKETFEQLSEGREIKIDSVNAKDDSYQGKLSVK